MAPLATLLVLVAIAAALLVANQTAAPTRTAAAPAAAPAAPAAPAPAPTQAPVAPVAAQQSIFAGRTSGNEMTLAIAVDNDRAVAYACDGKSVEAWLSGTVAGDQIDMRSPDGATLRGRLDQAAVLGTVTTTRGALPFAANHSQKPAGVYRSKTTINGLTSRLGWAVLPDGSQAGVSEAGGARTPAPQLDPASGRFDSGGMPWQATPLTPAAAQAPW